MTIDIHAHYVPAELIARIRSSKALGVNVIDAAQTPALTFEYGFSVRPFFPKLVEDMNRLIVKFLRLGDITGEQLSGRQGA